MPVLEDQLFGCEESYEVPFTVTPEATRPTQDYGERLDGLVAAGDRSGAVSHFMRNAMGSPRRSWRYAADADVDGTEGDRAHPPYDCAALGNHNMYGAPLNADEWASVRWMW